MLRHYLNQTAQLRRAQRDGEGNPVMDDRGRIQYEASATVSCRKEKREKETLTPDAQVIKTSWVYYVMDSVQTDDLLDGKRVQSCDDWVSLGGTVIGHKAVI